MADVIDIFDKPLHSLAQAVILLLGGSYGKNGPISFKAPQP
jgi:hypothetical protein